MSTDISYRLLYNAAELRHVVDLQHLIWGDTPEVVVPVNMLFSLAHNGCPILGAFAGELLVGCSIAFFGTDIPDSKRPALANLKLASKRLGVHPDYRSSGIGLALKEQQKAFAHQQGIRLITWTFNPLISRNAYFHIHKLGGIARQFHENYYEDIPGQVDSLGTSDRMICEWWLTSHRVEERLHGVRPSLTMAQYMMANTAIINPTSLEGDIVQPYAGTVQLGDSALQLVEIPAHKALLGSDPAVGMAWQVHIRQVFRLVFEAGYVATDFLHEEFEGRERSFYVLSFNGPADVG